MDDLIKLARTFRVTTGLAEEIIRLIAPDLRLFVASSVPHHSGQDVFQEVLKAVATNLGKFQGGTAGEFWAWCYRIARNKLADHFRKQSAERAQPMPPEEIHRLIDASTQATPLSPGERLELEYAMKLLTASKPECYEFLWQHFVIGHAYAEIAEEKSLTYDNVRMKISHCLAEAQSLVA